MIKRIKSVLNVSTHIITIRLAEILVIMSVSTFKTALILNVFNDTAIRLMTTYFLVLPTQLKLR